MKKRNVGSKTRFEYVYIHTHIHEIYFAMNHFPWEYTTHHPHTFDFIPNVFIYSLYQNYPITYTLIMFIHIPYVCFCKMTILGNRVVSTMTKHHPLWAMWGLVYIYIKLYYIHVYIIYIYISYHRVGRGKYAHQQNTTNWCKLGMVSWLVVSTPLKNISQWEGLSHIWNIKNVPNHQPTIMALNEGYHPSDPSPRDHTCQSRCDSPRKAVSWLMKSLKSTILNITLW